MAIQTQLVPLDEMTPGQAGAIRNSVINALVARAAQELSKSPDDIVVRDIRPADDIAFYSGGTTTQTVNVWEFTATGGTAGYVNLTSAAVMADQRYVAFFGVRDLRKSIGLHATTLDILTATGLGEALRAPFAQVVSLIRFNVGGGDRAIWDLTNVQAYPNPVGFTAAAVIIPQNTAYQLQYYFPKSPQVHANCVIQLIGVVAEPRGRTVSP